MKSTKNILQTRNVKNYPILWAIVHKPDRRKPAFIGICGYAWKPFIASDMLHAATMHDLCLDTTTGKCEEGNRCLNTKCPFNATTLRTLASCLNPAASDDLMKKLKKKLPRMIKDLATYLPFVEPCKKKHEENPRVHVFEFKEGNEGI